MKKKITPILFMAFSLGLMLFCHSAMAQRTIKGKVVTASDHTPIVGATVQLNGTDQGTSTGPNGEFTLTVPGKGNDELIISFIGYASQAIPVNGKSVVNVSLSESSGSLNEIVVTGYQSQRKADITGAVATVDSKDLNAIPQGNAADQLQGRVSGVTILSSGQPGENVQVRIRGFGSFTNNDPLYIIDGIPGDINSIDPNDIESISVLKDAGSASIYGSRAANGVVVVTTKKGVPGRMRVNYDVSFGNQYPGTGYKILNPTQTAQWTWAAQINAGSTPSDVQYGSGATPVLPDYILAGVGNYGLSASSPLVNPALYDGGTNLYAASTGDLNYQIVKANKAGTNWYEAVTRVAPIMNHSLSLSGGTPNATYNIALGYFDQQGVVLATYLKRYTLRANTEFNIHNRVKIGENMQILLGQNPMITNGSEGNAISWSYRENPLIPVYDIKGNFAGTAAKGFNNPQNPVADQTRAAQNFGINDDIFGDVYAEVRLPFYLTAKTTFGGDYSSYYYNSYTTGQYEDAENTLGNTVYEGAGYSHTWNWTNTLTFDHKFGQHHINAFIGTEAIANGIGDQINGSGLNPFSWQLSYRTLNTTQSGGRVVYDNPLAGYYLYSEFANLDYNYAEKYLVTFTIRRDGSSNFGANDRYGIFPAVSAGWRISQENFMKGISWINDLKIRGSWGQMGNQNGINYLNQFSLYAPNSQTASYDLSGSGNSLMEGIIRTNLANPNGHWETDQSANIGFDATLFNNTFNIVFDYYDKISKGLLYNPTVEGTVGYLTSYPFINIAGMENKGLDIQLDKRGRISSNWNYDVTVNLTTYQNNITSIAPGINYFDGYSYGSGRIGNTVTRNEVGHPISSFFGYKVIGLWQNQAEINAADAQAQKVLGNATATYQAGGEHVGEFRYADVTNQGYISDVSRTFIGNPNPKFTYGVNLNISYKTWDLTAFFYGSQGNQIYNYTKWWTDFYSSFPGAAVGADVLKSWTPSNTNTTVPIFENRSNLSTNGVNNSYYIENGSYLRLRTLELGYTFKKGALSKAGIDHLRLYVQAINLFTITKYSGLDPMISGITGGSTYDTNFGVDYGNYPTVRQFMGGIDLGF
ncbi:MAG TPA: TonB-dependent receptor [Chitinophagaceae bacterium]|nr:TonB-dependent receptor [Chitinophagaceae bacterium]